MYLQMASSAPAIAALILFLSRGAHAQQSASCLVPSMMSPNATGSVQLAGFDPPEASSNSTYTLSTALTSTYTSMNASASIMQSFYLSSSPQTDLAKADTPFTGCVYALAVTGNPKSTNPAGQNSDSCQGVLSSDCLNAIIYQANNASFAQVGIGASTDEMCATLLGDMPMECSGSSYTVLSVSSALGNPPPSAASACASSVPPAPIPSSSIPLLSTSSPSYMPTSSNSTYDDWVKQGTPVILSAWLKNGTTAGPWANTALVCVTANQVVTGSRVPSAGGRMEVEGWMLWVAGGIVGVVLGLGVGA